MEMESFRRSLQRSEIRWGLMPQMDIGIFKLFYRRKSLNFLFQPIKFILINKHFNFINVQYCVKCF